MFFNGYFTIITDRHDITEILLNSTITLTLIKLPYNHEHDSQYKNRIAGSPTAIHILTND
jgi:hypothetical protein